MRHDYKLKKTKSNLNNPVITKWPRKGYLTNHILEKLIPKKRYV